MKHRLSPSHYVFGWLFGLTVFSNLTLMAQSPASKGSVLVSDTAYFDMNKDLTEQLVPFDEIYQAALRYSPLLQVQNAVSDSKMENYRYTKVLVLDNIYPFVNYSQGNQTLVATGTNPTDGLQLSNGTRWGVNVQIPLTSIFGRRNLVQQAKADYRVTQAQKGVIALALKRELIVIYQNLVVAQRTMQVRLRDEQVTLTAYRVAEVETQQGKTTPDQLAHISNAYTVTKTYAERARGDFMISFYDLEALVGVPLQSLMLK